MSIDTLVCMYIHVCLLRVLTLTILVSTPAIFLAEQVYLVKLSFCSIVKTTVGMPPMVVLVTFSSTGNLFSSTYQETSAGGIPVAGQNSFTLLPGMTDKFHRPAPDTKVPDVLGSDIVVFIAGGSEKG